MESKARVGSEMETAGVTEKSEVMAGSEAETVGVWKLGLTQMCEQIRSRQWIRAELLVWQWVPKWSCEVWWRVPEVMWEWMHDQWQQAPAPVVMQTW